jgi:hypothetical protein
LTHVVLDFFVATKITQSLNPESISQPFKKQPVQSITARLRTLMLAELSNARWAYVVINNKGSMFRSVLFIFIATILTTCVDHSMESDCGTHATVKDLTGFDGCGFIFELEDGTRLEPMFLREEPLSTFEFADGKKVVIGYEEKPSASVCMIGKTVKIICIQEE